ncbi:hypothetical protein WA026_021861 [Henosepilachna vigintioctopunctata]|uniref:Integral membrane protein 2 n=1 Tax=Henosepilachna vigintioctopunctata TaxID=420089 RepID=A0AAW1UHJ9_9CUCU
MTILITPFSEKKGDTLIVPLVNSDHLAKSTEASQKDAEAQNGNIVFLNARARRVSNSTVLGLLMAALIVASIGIVGGLYIHRRFIHPPYRSMLRIDAERSYATITGDRLFNELQEELEIDLANEEFEKIDVPDFRDGRSETQLTFYTNYRCFVMPLNRGAVLPPRSFFDLINKMFGGYYKVDTQVVRETMHVVFPPLQDTKDIGAYIAQECQGMPIYKLEKDFSRVVKRSAELDSGAKFAQFAGKGITEIDIVNFSDVEKYEKGEK